MSLTKRAPNSSGLGFESHNKNDIQTGNRKVMFKPVYGTWSRDLRSICDIHLLTLFEK